MSFIDVPEGSDFTWDNLPYGVFSTKDNPKNRIGVAIGTKILDLSVISHLFDGPLLNDKQDVFRQTILNPFIALPRQYWAEARKTLQTLLSKDCDKLKNDQNLMEKAFVNQAEATMHLPIAIGDYTDFYSSYYHAVNCTKMFLGSEELTGNWKHLPTAYNGRSSSVVVSGTDIIRPKGQFRDSKDSPPTFGPTALLDYEFEMAFVVGGPPTQLGHPIPVAETQDHIFGMVILNDWSSRDIQLWEMAPLGPFLGKSFGTSISPWIVTMEALEPFLVPNPVQTPKPLEYLRHDDDYSYDILLETTIKPSSSTEAYKVAKTSFKHHYWTMKQQLAHHTVNGCNVNPGDLMGSGTVSGPTEGERGCMLELNWNRTVDIKLGDQKRHFLADGDEVVMKAHCENNGKRIGFGECRGTILPALP
ncbi:unnamed protein product [Bursaphelenchus okinawaensis]|uniref:Fumarylacetoacetase n=1 Tax=Bursaphelenchus okinawaensis TaxID=465554 RepID=A0A811L7N1_9BILA|nr:unnamed protein product [Bursaphelenchus okinawaensis]CAG9117304.1 unnamed protein product [Bursaphelenchus okinawaensis]